MLIHLLYYLFAGLVAMAAVSILFTSQVFYAALCLLGVSIGLSAIYFLQGATFIAVIYLIVYAGGVLVVILFALLFFRPPARITPTQLKLSYRMLTVLGVGLLLMPLLKWSISLVAHPSNPMQTAELDTSVVNIGYQLLGPYGLLVEIAGILLLIVLVGALYIVRDINQPK
jgi:NADH:ubiquinone oxidoreductase subunit 6 (subunit J)